MLSWLTAGVRMLVCLLRGVVLILLVAISTLLSVLWVASLSTILLAILRVASLTVVLATIASTILLELVSISILLSRLETLCSWLEARRARLECACIASEAIVLLWLLRVLVLLPRIQVRHFGGYDMRWC